MIGGWARPQPFRRNFHMQDRYENITSYFTTFLLLLLCAEKGMWPRTNCCSGAVVSLVFTEQYSRVHRSSEVKKK
jgi:hypothetical protein